MSLNNVGGADLNCRPPAGGYESGEANKKDPYEGLKKCIEEQT
jgi:hypothetical protein